MLLYLSTFIPFDSDFVTHQAHKQLAEQKFFMREPNEVFLLFVQANFVTIGLCKLQMHLQLLFSLFSINQAS